jgi:hypothetical protein
MVIGLPWTNRLQQGLQKLFRHSLLLRKARSMASAESTGPFRLQAFRLGSMPRCIDGCEVSVDPQMRSFIKNRFPFCHQD